MRTTLTSTAVALSAAALTVGLATAAHAELYGVDDPQDTYHGSDIRSLSVRNTDHNLHVASYHEGLRRDPRTGSGGAVFIDTDRDDWGPEYVFAAGFTEGTDYALLETEGFSHHSWGDRVEHGDYIMKVMYKRDRVRFTMSRHAIGDPTDVRVAMKASGTRTDGTRHHLTDWVGQKRDFTPWIAQG